MAAAAAVAAVHVLRLPRIVVDDAFISFRYALQFVRGHGLVFNPGEYVEGYSNALWVWMIAAGMRLNADPIAVARSIGAVAYVGCVIAAVWLTGRLARSHVAAAACGAMLAASTTLCSSSLSGLETGLYALCVTGGAAAFVTRRFGWASIVFALAGLTRPEGFALLIVAVACAAANAGQRRRMRPRDWIVLMAPATAVLLGMLAFRLAYYGAAVPNSVAAKSALWPLLQQAPWRSVPRIVFNEPGLNYVGGFLAATVGLLAPICILPIGFSAARRPAATFLGTVVLMGLAVAVYNFGDWMASYRLLTPYLPLLAVLVWWGTAVLARRAKEWLVCHGSMSRVFVHRSPATADTAVAQVLRATVPAAVIALAVPTVVRGWQRNLPMPVERADRELASLLQSSRQPNLLAATDVLGRLGYYAPDVPIIDMAGLTDAHIARHGRVKPTFGRWDVDYVLSRRPHLLMTNVLPAWKDVLRRPAFNRKYVWMDEPSWRGGRGSPARYVFLRRGCVLEDELRAVHPAATFRNPSDALDSYRGQ